MPLPYSISDENGIATFVADNHALYKAFFLSVPATDAPQLEGFVVDFSFERDTTNCLTTKHRMLDGSFKKLVGRDDKRIKATLQKIVDDFFEFNPFFVVYFTCDATDGKQCRRLHLFNEWHEAHREQFMKIPFHINGIKLDGTEILGETVGGVIFLNHHPHRILIETYVASEVLVYNGAKL